LALFLEKAVEGVTVNEQRGGDAGQRSTDNGQQTTDNGQQSTVNGQRSIVNRQQTTDNGLLLGLFVSLLLARGIHGLI
jgi:hypothetical protein